MRGYNLLSLFGGIETGYAALRDAGVPIANYYSSEIDKNAIKVSAYNYPEIVHIGDENGNNIIAESNQYKALGNGWVMKVVSHIFSFLPELK